MKQLLTLFSFVLTLSINAQTFSTNTPINVATGMGNYHPELELLSDGTPVVLWTDINSFNLYFAKHNGVDAFDTPIQLNPTGTDVQAYTWSGPGMEIEGNNIYVAYHSYGVQTGHIYFTKSTDNGANWSDTVRVDNVADGYAQFPDIAVFQDTLWVVLLDHDASGLNPHYRVTRSTDGGATWEPDVLASELWPGESCDCCEPEIIVDAERVIIVTRNNDNNVREMKATVSYDRGQTFTDTYSVDDHGWTIASCPSVGADADFLSATHSVTTYRTMVGTDPKIFLVDYDLEGDSIYSEVDVYAASSANTILNYPQLDYANGVLGIAWESVGNGIDVYINASSVGVDGIDPNNAFNLTDVTGTQNKPSIAVGTDVFHIAYMDSDGNNVKYVQASYLAGTATENLAAQISVYPIPAEDKVTISFVNEEQNSFTIDVFDMTGRVIEQITGNGNQVILDCQNYQSGTYLFNLNLNNQLNQGRFVIE
ncbi:T9SS type A sorting domain-containing protein [Paracrocinitomix mangrovi]|uniref:T9SS type A sorting domain-containing protein n=1 Tax=Paracrocinitomix mangrovi TaxID=2862509 RepID=UPI001C8EA198|nr:T9SS type A sorting domain-containing protein [Paracrocinitomix mangrovi]UKN03369.1 T9SS type A sorting domain-containing protein [Paracrocinitomix mangrovi]